MIKKLLYTFFSIIVISSFFSCSKPIVLTEEEKKWLQKQ